MTITAPALDTRVHAAAAAALRTVLVTVLAGGLLGRLGMRLLALSSPTI